MYLKSKNNRRPLLPPLDLKKRTVKPIAPAFSYCLKRKPEKWRCFIHQDDTHSTEECSFILQPFQTTLGLYVNILENLFNDFLKDYPKWEILVKYNLEYYEKVYKTVGKIVKKKCWESATLSNIVSENQYYFSPAIVHKIFDMYALTTSCKYFNEYGIMRKEAIAKMFVEEIMVEKEGECVIITEFEIKNVKMYFKPSFEKEFKVREIS